MEIKSAFAMTEPAIASSDALNIECELSEVDGKLFLNGRKWYISNGLNPLTEVFFVLCKDTRVQNYTKI